MDTPISPIASQSKHAYHLGISLLKTIIYGKIYEEVHGQSRAMAKAAATQLLSFLPSFLHQARRGRVRSRILSTGYKEQKSRRPRAATLGPADARRACPRVGRRFLRGYVCQHHKVPKSQAIPDLNITIPGPKQVIVFNVILGNYITNFDLK